MVEADYLDGQGKPCKECRLPKDPTLSLVAWHITHQAP